MAKQPSRARLTDVAQRANVSITSVSRMINHSGPINEETRARIESAIAELGFEVRRPPAKNAEPTVAVIAGNLTNAYFPEIIRGMQEEAENYGMLTVLFTMSDVPQRRQQILEKISKSVVEAVVVMGAPLFPRLAETQASRRIPTVVINRRAQGAALGSISVDFENAGYRLTQHLLMLGHRRIGYVANATPTLDVCVARRRGLEAALHEAGLCLCPEWTLTSLPGVEMDGGYAAMTSFLAQPMPERPSAFVCFNDSTAVGVQHAMHAAGLRIPADYSVTGFDDIAVAAHANPPLTTIAQPKYRIGMMTIQMLRKMLQNPADLGDSILVESPLVVRESTGPYLGG